MVYQCISIKFLTYELEFGGENKMSLMFVKVDDCDLEQYKKDMQEAFQKGFEDDFGKTEEIILPEEDINSFLYNSKCRE